MNKDPTPPADSDDRSFAERVEKVRQQLRELEAEQRERRREARLAKPRPIRKGIRRHVNRNHRCPCGSGKKFKNCHGAAR